MREVVVSPEIISLLICDRCRERRWLAGGQVVDALTALRLAARHDATGAPQVAGRDSVVDLTDSKGA